MKRSELRRKTGLKADPAKTKAFVGRGRVAGAESLRPATKRCKACRAQMLAHLRQCPSCGARPVAEAAEPRATKLPTVRFHARQPARAQDCAEPGCSRKARTWHHWLPQQQIRAYVRSLRLPDSKSRPLLRRLLRDERNLSPFCGDHHGEHGTTAHEFEHEQVPASAFEFAGDLGPEWRARLERMYPQRAA